MKKIKTAMILCIFLAIAHLSNAATVNASSSENDSTGPSYAFDNNLQSRWSSGFSDRQWLQIDLGRTEDLVGLIINWEAAYARSYDVLISEDGKNWENAYSTSEGEGVVDDVYFGRKKARFIKLDFKERGTAWGYSIWEIRIKGLDDEIPIKTSSDNGRTTISIELKKDRNIGALFITWGEDFPRSYRVEIEEDNRRKTVYNKEVCTGGQDRIYANIFGKRHIKINCEDNKGKESVMKKIEFKDWDDIAKHKGLDKARGLAGWEGSKFKTFIGKDGSFAVYPYPFRVSFWVNDDDRLYTPETLHTDWKLVDGGYPVTVVSWKGNGIEGETKIFSWLDEKAGKVLTFARESVKNTSARDKEVLIMAVIRPNPLYPKWKVTDMKTIEYDADHTVKINGAPRLFLDERAEGPLGKDLKDSLSYRKKIPAGTTESLDFIVPSGTGAELSFNDIKDKGFDEALALTFKYWKGRIPLVMNIPDKRYSDCFYSSLYYILIMDEEHKLFPGPYEYTSFFMHDAIDMDNALDKAGLTEEARASTEHFNYKEGGGYVDELGGSIFAPYEHYRLTKDVKYLEAAYPRMKSACELIRKVRAPQMSLPKEDVAYGLLPKGVSQDNFKIPAYLYVDDWWAMIGLKAAYESAQILGKPDDAKWMKAEYGSLHSATIASIEKSMKKNGLSFMPGFADYWPKEMRIKDMDHRILGDTQMAWAHRPALFPGENMGIPVPAELFKTSYEQYWKNAGKFSDYDGGWFVEYEQLFWGYNFKLAHPLIYIGMEDVALKSIEWGIEHQSCPGGWMEAMPTKVNSKGLREITEGIVGDVPHGWSAAHYILLLRDMLFREDGDKLVLLSCIPDSWLDDGKVIEIKDAPTYFGKVSFKVESSRAKGFVKLSTDCATPPPGGYILTLGKNRISVPADTKELEVKF
ncbi:MAG: discoidin domain-containing protein [Candidatus Omnitrophica bacterium]|nr:discoidin domain-containing protein [Candidatus Omnitrophota bacterium]